MCDKIIFLDIDGVLNYAFLPAMPAGGSKDAFDEVLVSNLKTILTAVPNSKIVISSSWRVSAIMEHVSFDREWKDVLEDQLGIHGCVVGSIGLKHEFGQEGTSTDAKAIGREYDIRDWLDAHPEVSDFVILDDYISEDQIPKMFPNNYVRCTTENGIMGLTDKLAKKAIWILTKDGREKSLAAEQTFVISDTHFGHAKIIDYCNRPWTSVEQMDADMIAKWNAIVKPNDTIWHLGDFAFGKGKKERIPKLVEQLNGKIKLVMGNHDDFPYKFYLDAGFYRVYDHPTVIDSYIIMSHEVVSWVKADGVYVNLHGHVHNQQMYQHCTPTSYNCCVEVNGYAPISWKKITDDIMAARDEDAKLKHETH